MDVENPHFQWNKLCRLCRKSSDEKTPISQLFSKHRLPISQLIARCIGIQIYDFDRLPQHVCAECLEELDRAYSTWLLCNSLGSDPPEEVTTDAHCRICSYDNFEELISTDCMTEDGCDQIKDVLRIFAGYPVNPHGGPERFLCRECCSQLERSFEFRKRCLQTQVVFTENCGQSWEKMEFQTGEPAQLVVELCAKILIREGDPNFGKCSVCFQPQFSGQKENACKGCLLEFSNAFEAQSNLQQRVMERINGTAADSNAVKETPRKIDKKDLKNNSSKTEERRKPISTSYFRNFLAMHSLSLEDAFPTLEEFHLYLKVQRKIPMCDDCNEFFPSGDSLTEHCTLKHKDKKQFICDICVTCFNVEENFQRHIQAGQHGSYEYCKLCKRILSAGQVLRHLTVSHVAQWKEFTKQQESTVSTNITQSSTCSAEPQTRKPMSTKYFRNFLATHSLSLEEAFPALEVFPMYSKVQRKVPMCDDCSEFFPSENALAEHCAQKHANSMLCKTCLTCFGTQSAFQRHVQTDQHGIHDYCKLCKRILLSGQIERHLMLSHVSQWREFEKLSQEVIQPPKSTLSGTDNVTAMECDFLEDVDTHASMDYELTETMGTRTQPETLIQNDTEYLWPIDTDEPTKDSAAPLPTDMFRKFLQQSGLELKELFDVVEDNQYALILRRKIPFCCGCNQLFLTERARQIHISKTHRQKIPAKHTCHACFSTVGSKNMIQRHITKLTTELLHGCCKQCDKIFPSPRCLVLHLFDTHFDKAKQLQIESLFRRVTSGETDLNTVPMKYVCRIGTCTYTASRMETVLHCITVPHPDSSVSDAYPAPINTLNELFETIVDEAELPYFKVCRKGPMCCECDTFFLQQTELDDHRKTVHEEIVSDCTFHCAFCCKAFRNQENLDLHNRKRESDTYDYCRHCEVVLLVDSYDQHEMKQHPMVKNLAHRIEESFDMYPETLYKCCVPTCNTRHDSSAELLKHCELVHQRISTSKTVDQMCAYCGEYFHTKTDLLEHGNRQAEFVRFTCKSENCAFFTYNRAQMYDHGTSCIPERRLTAGKDDISSGRFIKAGSMDELIDIVKPKGLICCGCDTIWNSEVGLRRHVEEKHPVIKNNHQFRCSTCNRGFSTEAFLLRHRANRDKRYYCRLCKIQLLSLGQVTHHKLYVHSFDEPTDLAQYYQKTEYDGFPCCGCDQQFPTMDDLAAHCLQSHPALGVPKEHKYECEKCHLPLAYKNLTTHGILYGNKIIYKCKFKKCDRITTSLQAMEHHVSAIPHEKIWMKANKPTKYCCVQNCTFGSSCYEDIIEHAEREHEDVREHWRTHFPDKPVSCPVCCKGYNNEIQYENHRRRQGRTLCKICNLTFEYHKMEEHASKCGSYQRSCAKCDEKFTSLTELRRHMRIAHGEKQEVRSKMEEVCNICGKIVKCLKPHLESHYNKRAWECQQCHTRFNSSTLLNLHIRRVHSNVKEFFCRRGCQNSYKYTGDRDRHEKIAHTRDLPHKCSFCSSAFVRDRDLRLHMRKHTGRKLYVCSRCSQDFNKKSELTEHEAECSSDSEDILGC